MFVLHPPLSRARPRPDKPLTILLFAAGWNPAAMFVAEALRDLRDARDLNFATVLIVDTWDEAFEGKGWAVPVTPAITFLCKGRVLTIRRPGWSDADQCTRVCVMCLVRACVATPPGALLASDLVCE